MTDVSLSDMAAVMGNGRESFLEGNGIIILILFFLLMGGNGCGYNNAGAGYGIGSGTYENARLIDNVNYNLATQSAGIQQAINSGIDSVNANINNLSYQMQQCCCTLRTQMLEDRNADLQNQLNQAIAATANTVQSQYILGQLGRYYSYPPINPYAAYGTTIA